MTMVLWLNANSLNPDQTAHMHRVYTGRIGYKPHVVMVRHNYVDTAFWQRCVFNNAYADPTART